MSSKAQKQAKADAREARIARDAQIVAKVMAGEKRYMLAEEYGLDPHTIGQIAERAGLPPRKRFKRPENNQKDETWHADSRSSKLTQTCAPCSTAG